MLIKVSTLSERIRKQNEGVIKAILSLKNDMQAADKSDVVAIAKISSDIAGQYRALRGTALYEITKAYLMPPKQFLSIKTIRDTQMSILGKTTRREAFVGINEPDPRYRPEKGWTPKEVNIERAQEAWKIWSALKIK